MKIDISDISAMPSNATSSKGNQSKWHIDDYYLKKDTNGYEGLAEVLSGRILEKSNADAYVIYDFAQIIIMGESYTGCVSKEMKNAGEVLVPLERLVRLERNINLTRKIRKFDTPMERIKYTVDILDDIGVEDAGRRLTQIMEIDAVTLNQDRHTNNIAIMQKENRLFFSPIYDNGDAFFSDLVYFPEKFTTEELLKRVTAKPFSGSFEKQKLAAQELYGEQLEIYFSMDDLIEFCHDASKYYPEKYIERIKNIARMQLDI